MNRWSDYVAQFTSSVDYWFYWLMLLSFLFRAEKKKSDVGPSENRQPKSQKKRSKGTKGKGKTTKRSAAGKKSGKNRSGKGKRRWLWMCELCVIDRRVRTLWWWTLSTIFFCFAFSFQVSVTCQYFDAVVWVTGRACEKPASAINQLLPVLY